MFGFNVCFVAAGVFCQEEVQAENVDQAVIFARDQARKMDGVWGKASNVVVRMRFTYNGKDRAGQVVEHGDGWVKLDEGQAHPKTYTLAKAVA